MSRLILVSHRLPFTLRRQGNKLVLARSAGGLVAGLAPIHETARGLWFGYMGMDLDRKQKSLLQRNRLMLVSLPRERARRHYEGFSNGVLWPLFHYFLESVQFDPKDFEAYHSVNERFADAIAAHARPGDRIWVHDYHLLLLPAMLRRRIPGARIGFFLHIPFPVSEVFGVLPKGQEILEGLLGADLIGLHTYGYARYLTKAYRRFLGLDLHGDALEWEGRRCYIRVFPLGVQADELKKQAASPDAERRLAGWKRRVGGRKVVLGIDRLDYSKGLPLRLSAYRRLLAAKPEWRREALFLQLAVPTRGGITKHRQLKEQVEQLVGEINGEYGELGRVPVHYMHRSVPPEELAALYRLADVAVVTPLRDGMNLVAKEFIASRQDDSGVLVLSQFAGAASELGEALLVNPWDLDGCVHAMDRALRMGREEVSRRMSALRKRVSGYDAGRWAASFLEKLEECGRLVATCASEATEGSWRDRLLRSFAVSRSPMVVLSYDGTLREFEADPSAAQPAPPLLDLLGRLSRRTDVEAVLISGRDRDTLERWFGHLPLHLVAEHGFHLRFSGRKEWEELAPGIDRSWLPLVEEAMKSYVARTPGSFIERKQAGLTWHYRAAEPALGLRQARELAHHLTEYFANRELRVLHGWCIVEVRSQGINKGAAYRTLAQRLPEADFILVAGDDRTDEDLFRAVPADAWTIKIGPGETFARSRLLGPDQLRALLEEIVSKREEIAGLKRSAALESCAPRHRETIKRPGG